MPTKTVPAKQANRNKNTGAKGKPNKNSKAKRNIKKTNNENNPKPVTKTAKKDESKKVLGKLNPKNNSAATKAKGKRVSSTSSCSSESSSFTSSSDPSFSTEYTLSSSFDQSNSSSSVTTSSSDYTTSSSDDSPKKKASKKNKYAGKSNVNKVVGADFRTKKKNSSFSSSSSSSCHCSSCGDSSSSCQCSSCLDESSSSCGTAKAQVMSKKAKKRKSESLSTSFSCDDEDACVKPKKKKLDKAKKDAAGSNKNSTGKLSKKEEKPKKSTSSDDSFEITKPTAAQLLQNRMKKKLDAGRFRHLNEQLYTTTGKRAFEIMTQDPEAFNVYHKGFRAQVQQWPKNPVDKVITYIKERSNKLVIADFGCGEAKLAQSVPNKVHSFDFQAVNDHVTVCDMAKTPLNKNSVDIAVFCLSLMGTNLSDFLIEANRVMKKGGTLLIAEVVSRFNKTQNFLRKLKKLGFNKINQDNSNKMFIWFELKKVQDSPKENVPEIVLAPCLYKKR